MANVLFTNARIIDGSGAQPYTGDVLVQGNRIARVGRGVRTLPNAGVNVVDAGGATLMPGLVEAHTHFSWNDQPSLNAIQRMPTEEHVLWCAHVAKRYLDMGFTSCVGAATAKPRLDVVIRNAIESGQIPGPRYLAASQEITVPGGLGDETLPHLPYPEFSFGAVVNGVEEMRKCVRMFLKYGVDTIKLNLSGEYIAGIRGRVHADDRRRDRDGGEGSASARQARVGARALERIGQAVRAPRHRAHLSRELRRRGGARHAGSGEGPPLRRARSSRGSSTRRFTPANGASRRKWRRRWATTASWRSRARRSRRCTSAASASCPAATTASRGSSTARTRRTSSISCKYLGFTPMEALLAATKLGGEIMMRGRELGQIREGFLADLLLVDGDPLTNIAVLRERERILAVMKDGVFHREPEAMPGRSRYRLSVA